MSAGMSGPGLEISSAWVAVGADEQVPTVSGPDRVGPIASTAKVAVLATLAMALDRGDVDPTEPLSLPATGRVGGTGLLQAMTVSSAALHDLAVLTAGVSDNVATNVIIRRLGLAAVGEQLARSGVPDVVVLDVVRDDRDATVPPAFAVGTARGLCRMMASVGAGAGITSPARSLLLGWMRHNQDRAYVPDAFVSAHPAVEVVNKTGTDAGVLADTGLVLGGDVDLAYAVVARWSGDDAANRSRAASAFRAFGADLVALAGAARPGS
ncbi:serine hydrolase [Nocardioides sp. R1-1]|uniref:serine hydrolase n=1 Tax=Nocardioides sp. R1-1 TaxID=3383502 RepID=UPI0038D154B5